MDDRSNTIIGWALGAGIVALGLTSLTNQIFKAHDPEKPGFVVEGGEGGGAVEKKGPAIETLLQTADAGKGEAVFAQCKTCHTIDAGGANGVGPNLHGVMGEAVATGRGGFAFSDALKAKGGKWDWQAMNDWLTSPRKFANGTKMSFAGLSNAEDRANLMVYLNAQGSNLPLPAAPAPDAAPEGTTPAPAGDAAKAPPGGTMPATDAAKAPAGGNAPAPSEAGPATAPTK